MTEKPETWSMQLPKMKDDDIGDVVTLKTDFGSATFVQLRDNVIEIEDISANTNGKVVPGIYILKYILTDGKDESSFSQLLTVKELIIP